MRVFFTACQNESNLLIFLVLFACIYGGDEDIVDLVNIARGFVAFSKTYVSTCFCHYHLSPYFCFHSVFIIHIAT
jgi:hypothetical protein